MKSLKWLGIAVLLLAICRCNEQKSGLPFYNTPDFTPVWLKPGDDGYEKIHTIPAFAFTDQFGVQITNKNTKGKIYVANFFFASCRNICPAMMGNLQKVNKTFAGNPDVLILSHSVTPLSDSVPALRKYADEHHIGKNWLLLTGDRENTYNLARKAYFADDESGFGKSPNEFLHTENVVLVDTKGRIRGVYNSSLTVEINMLIEDIKQLQKEI